MNYRGRPVFDFLADWGNPINKSFAFDLKEVSDVGYGKSFFTSLQQDVVQGFQVTLRLLSDNDILAVDAFFAGLNGRLSGFWFPAPIESFEIAAARSQTEFDIVAQGFADTWDDQPGTHLYFCFSGVNAAAKIVSVVDLGNGLERVTVDTAIADYEILFRPQAFVYRLHYVRLATDTESAKFISEGQQDRTISVVELPAEYDAYEAGEKKVILYHFWCEAPMDFHWRYTSFAANFISQNSQYNAYPITHGEFRRDAQLSNDPFEVSAQYDVNTPFALFFPVPMSRPLFVQIFETTIGAPDIQKVFFSGRVMAVPDPEDRVKAECRSFAWLLDQRGPGPMIGPNCPYDVYNPATCKAVRAKFETTGIVSAANPEAIPPTMTVTLNFPTSDRKTNDWFAQGFIEMGLGLEYEVRQILSSKLVDGDTIKLQLNAETKFAAEGDIVQLIPGCDGAAATCQNKFKNYDNFGGFPAVPSKNPSLTSIQSPVSEGGKGK